MSQMRSWMLAALLVSSGAFHAAAAPDPTCQVVPPPAAFDMALAWAWPGSPTAPAFDQVMMTPVVAQLTDDNGDGAIDRKDTPDVVFTTFQGGNYQGAGVLRTISGAGGGEIWSVTDPALAVRGEGSIAVADIDG